MYGYVSYPRAMGAPDTRVAVVTCPTCSYLKDGDCVVCITGEDHPGCAGCSDGEVVWYRRPLFVSVVTAVVVSLVAGVVVHQVEKRSATFQKWKGT